MKKSEKFIIVICIFLVLVFITGVIKGEFRSDNSSAKNTSTKTDYFHIVKNATEKQLGKDAESISVSKSGEDGGKMIVKFLYTGTVWDETDFVNTLFSHYVDVCKKAYSEKDAIPIYFQVDVELEDSKGNKENETVLFLEMPIEEFNTYNWKNLEYNNLDFDMVEADCTTFVIKSPIINYWDKTKFMYKN